MSPKCENTVTQMKPILSALPSQNIENKSYFEFCPSKVNMFHFVMRLKLLENLSCHRPLVYTLTEKWRTSGDDFFKYLYDPLCLNTSIL